MVKKLKYSDLIAKEKSGKLTPKEKKKLERMKRARQEKKDLKYIQKIKTENPEEYKRLILQQRIKEQEKLEKQAVMHRKQRIKETEIIREKLREIQLHTHYSGCKEFEEHVKNYVETGKNLSETKIYFNEAPGLYLVLILKPRKCSITVKNYRIPPKS